MDIVKVIPEIQEPKPPERPALLVVDDDTRNLLAIAETLSGLDADVHCARSGRDALRKVLQHSFCAIFMDVKMPDMNGYETAALIREREKSRRIPVIFLTAYDKDDAQIFEGYSAGAVDYVIKPVEPFVLRSKASVFIDLFKQSEKIRYTGEQEKQLLQENLLIRNERLEVINQLRASEKRESMIYRSLPIAVYEAEIGEQGMVRTFLHNESVQRLLGHQAADFASDPSLWVRCVEEADWDEVSKAINALKTEKRFSVEYRWRCADGTPRYFLDQGVVVPTHDSRTQRVVGTMFDIHDRRMLEQQLLRAQKMDIVGKLTGGLAHDFNNMLTVVIGNLDSLQRKVEEDARLARHIQHALHGALHCRDVTKRLLGFAGRESLSPHPTNLNELIEGLKDLVSRTLGEQIQIRMSPDSALWEVCVDSNQVEAALLNLLVNARDAMPEGGTVTIETANITLGKSRPAGSPDLVAGDYVTLAVADTGVGMSPDVLKSACEEFFTTKESGHGTGLGLSTIHGFAKRSGGDLRIESVPGSGTTVYIYLPRHEADGRSRKNGRPEKERQRLPGTQDGNVVLVVEDEDGVRETAAGTLRELGYRVIEAATASAAMKVLDGTEEVDLLFTDIIMPGSTNGYQLACEASRRQPDLKILYTSAHSGEAISGIGTLRPFLKKPYRDYELAHAIHEALADER